MQTTMVIIGLVIAAIGAILFLAQRKVKNMPAVADHEKIINLTDNNFSQVTRNKTILIDFWASWCAPCKMMAPVLNEVAGELNGNSFVGKVNVEQYQQLARKFNVRNIPTLVLLKNGVEVNRFVGFKNKEFLLQQMNAVL